MRRHLLRSALVFLYGLVGVASLGAQTVRGAIVARGTREPVNGGIVALLDSAGRALAATMADDSGRYVLKAPSGGAYRVRVERVGFRSFLSDAITVADGETRELTLEVTSEATQLNAMRITADQRCLVRPQDGLAAAELWNEARKALYATRFTQTQRQVGIHVRRFERELDPGTLAVRSQTAREVSGDTDTPFFAVETSVLQRLGFSRREPDGSWTYFAPDAEVLLSEFFLDTHCLMVMPPVRGGQLGLIFEPVSSRTVPEVKGVLWFDPRTFALRSMQYQYVNLALGREIPTDKLGGRMVFSALPNGRWMVERWSIRMPQIAEERLHNAVTGMPEGVRRVLTSIKEGGGEVLEVLPVGMVGGPKIGSVSGIVYDSVKQAPIPGSRVFLSGTRYAARTNQDGQFTIDSVPPGEFVLSVVEPRLDTLQLEPPAISLTMSAGEQKRVNVALPSFITLLSARCTGIAIADTSAAILGVARDELTGKPAAGATVRVSWQQVGGTSSALRVNEQMAEAVVERNGRYAVCGLPPDKPVTIRAVRGKERGKDFSLRTIGRFVHRIDLRAPTAEP